MSPVLSSECTILWYLLVSVREGMQMRRDWARQQCPSRTKAREYEGGMAFSFLSIREREEGRVVFRLEEDGLQVQGWTAWLISKRKQCRGNYEDTGVSLAPKATGPFTTVDERAENC